ncbi:hypothetical protein SPURM210S_07727 [Streptomyces purpurascens]
MTGLGLLRPGPDGLPRYAHPLLRDAVLTGVPAARRRAVHRTAAEAMLHRGAPTAAVARHLLRSGPVGADWAPAVLRDAASLALRDGRSDDAVAFLRRALEEPLPDDHRQRVLTELGSLECAGRDSSAGIPRLTEALGLHGTPQDRVRAAVALGTALAGRGRARAAVEVLRTVDGQLTGHPDLGGALETASALLSDQDQTVRSDVYRRLSETAERSPELVGPATRALLVRYAASAALTSAGDAMRQVRALLAEPAHPLTEPFLLGTSAAVAQWADELDEADRLVDRGLAGQRPDLLHPMHAALLNTRADIAAARGEYTLLPAEPPTHAHGPSNVHATTLIALVETGRTAEARRLADGFDLREAPDNWELNRFLYARGAQRAAAGDTAGALHDFLECGRRQSAREVVSPVVTPWRSAAAECRLASRQPPGGARPGRGGAAAGPGVGHAPHGRPRPQGARHGHRRPPGPAPGRGGRRPPRGRAGRHGGGAGGRAPRAGPAADRRGRTRPRPGLSADRRGTRRAPGRGAAADPGGGGPARGRGPPRRHRPHRLRRPHRERSCASPGSRPAAVRTPRSPASSTSPGAPWRPI